MHRRLAALIALLATCLAPSCGDESGLSKQELIAKGDALCNEARRNAPRPPRDGTLPLFVRYVDQVIKVSDTTLAKFNKLEPRESERKRFDAFLAAAERRQKTVREAGNAARAGDASAAEAALRRERQQDAPEYRRLAKQLGFKVCGSGGA